MFIIEYMSELIYGYLWLFNVFCRQWSYYNFRTEVVQLLLCIVLMPTWGVHVHDITFKRRIGWIVIYVLPGVSRQYIRFKSRDQTLLTQTCRASLNLAKSVPFFFSRAIRWLSSRTKLLAFFSVWELIIF